MLTEERTATEECYKEAVGRHNDWKTACAKEARAEKLRQDKLARLLKVEALKKEKEEAERRRRRSGRPRRKERRMRGSPRNCRKRRRPRSVSGWLT